MGAREVERKDREVSTNRRAEAVERSTLDVREAEAKMRTLNEIHDSTMPSTAEPKGNRRAMTLFFDAADRAGMTNTISKEAAGGAGPHAQGSGHLGGLADGGAPGAGLHRGARDDCMPRSQGARGLRAH